MGYILNTLLTYSACRYSDDSHSTSDNNFDCANSSPGHNNDHLAMCSGIQYCSGQLYHVCISRYLNRNILRDSIIRDDDVDWDPPLWKFPVHPGFVASDKHTEQNYSIYAHIPATHHFWPTKSSHPFSKSFLHPTPFPFALPYTPTP